MLSYKDCEPSWFIFSHSTHKFPIKIMLRELLTPDIQRIKSICAIGAMLQQVLL